jgi:SAM-dependent methyltransferase
MRTTVFKLLERVSGVTSLPTPIVEFGARRVPGQEHLPPIASLFADVTYAGSDMQPGLHVDQVHDLHSLGFADNSIGTALLLDVVEHVREPWVGLAEVHRCLKPGGVVIMTSHFYFPIHAYPDDFWRFSSSGFAVLLKDYTIVANMMSGHRRLPHTVCAIASKGPIQDDLGQALRASVRLWGEREASSWKEAALTTMPPFLVVPCYDVFQRIQAIRNRRPDPR